MFSNAYQNGPSVEIFDSKANNEKNQFYKQLCKVYPSNNKKYFDKEVKSFIYQFQGHTGKIVFPADDHKQLSLTQRYLVLQICIPIGSNWSLQIGLTDINKTKRRINITTIFGKQQTKYFSLRYPLFNIIKGTWIFLGIDIYSFMEAFKGQVFRSLDHITITSNCRLRRVFTLKEWNQWEIPKNYWLSGQIQQTMQLIEYGQKKTQSMIQSIPTHEISRVKSTPKKIEKQSKISVKNSLLGYQKKENSSILSKKSHEFNSAIINSKMTKSQITSIFSKQPKARMNSIENEIERKNNNIFKLPQINKPKNHNKIKAPVIEKSFQEDEILNTPRQQSDIPQSRMQSKQETIQEDKWSDLEAPKRIRQAHNTQTVLQKIENTFPTTIITKQNNQAVIIQKKQQKQLQLIYDEMVGCYYHPETNTYYQIN